MSFSGFVGIPYADLGRTRQGADCYGLLRLVYAEALGIELASFSGAYGTCAEHAEIAALMADEAETGPWRPIEEIAPYDALLFRVGRFDCHVAIAVDARRMLHAHARSSSVIVPRSDRAWRDRFAGAYRHEARL
ncbi:C40 family peptidase [Salipiger thiooxidans]|uniref:C40 family peptidase n=1 Tax=Salipiger thiooxidans TaxID=282683 RepID=UPI001CD3B1C6|nr:NlpC/P60 family protein [Salipiger thiooxidans]MCA0851303.1 C40 family peptidase [Salipiger thiooxidans]